MADDYRSAEVITGALEFLSAAKMQELRQQFEQNALFFNGISEVYSIVHRHSKEKKKKGWRKSRSAQRADIYIALTSNKRFYGTLNRDIARSFIAVMKSQKDADYVMVGQTGAQYLNEAEVSNDVTYMDFLDDSPNADEFQKIISLVDSHERVFMVYPKFVNPFRQEVVMTNVAEGIVPDQGAATDVDYIFEPEIPGMIEFFEGQVRYALFGRVMLEAELARAAARTMKMHSARDRAGDLRAVNERILRHEFDVFADIERMASFTGFNAWRI